MESQNIDIKKNIGKSLRYYRKQKGFSQYELAERTNVSQSYISEIERGMKVPSLETIEEIAEVLGIEVWDLFLPHDLPPTIKETIKSLIKFEFSHS